MADPEHLSGETEEQCFRSLSRSGTESRENLEKANEEAGEAEKISKPQGLSSTLESFKDVEGIWFNKDVWVIPPAASDDEVLGSSLVDDDDDDDDEEGGWEQHPSSVRNSSVFLQSRIRVSAKMESDFMLVVKNLLQEEGIPEGEEGDPNSWLQIVSKLALQAANYVKPNTSQGGGMDPSEYVKVKCIASGKHADSTLVKGIVCHKNVLDRRMASRFKNPRLLLLGGALEYQGSMNQISSLTELRQQESDFLTATVARIVALHPNVLMVEKTVAGLAQETLLSKAVSLVLKVKRPVLDRIARCTGANVISSVDNFETAKVGQCEQFRIERFEEELNPRGGPGSTKKNAKYLTFFEGCPRPLGCTILLQGTSTEELKRVKKAVQLTVPYAYHLYSETSFLADEGATLPPNPLQCIPSSKRSSLDSTISTVPGFILPPSRVQGRNNLQAEDGMLHRVSSTSLDTQRFTEFTEEEFPPSTPDHQSIVVSFSSRTMSKGNVCEKPHLKRIKYYGASDKPFGIFLKEFLGNTVNRCPHCEEPMEDHEHRYTHANGCLTLHSKVLEGFSLPGEKEGKIWMWHQCLRCPRPDGIPASSRRVPLSDAAQNLSFGKLLQLNFSQQIVVTIEGCGHYVYRDCLRFFGIGNTVVCLMYNPIKLLRVLVPPPQLEFNIPTLQKSSPDSPVETIGLGSRAEQGVEVSDIASHSLVAGGSMKDPGKMEDGGSDVFLDKSLALERQISSPLPFGSTTVPKAQQFSLHGVARVGLPSGVNGTVVAVYEDEPTSVIAYAITSREYQNQLRDPVQEDAGNEGAGSVVEVGTAAVDVLMEESRSTSLLLEQPCTSMGSKSDILIEKALTSPTPLTVKVRFTYNHSDITKTDYQVVCYYTRQFLALRHKCCGGETEYIRSLSRCKTWGAQGGKSGAYFAKTLDDRFIVKQVSSTELYSFLEFAPQYFKHLWETMSSGSPTCLAKVLGFYTVTVRKGGKGEKEMDMMVMENLAYGKTVSRVYDLKGSLGSRYNPDATGTLLDGNLLKDMPTRPIFMTNKSKLLLERAVYNDTSFLAKVHVMDYSLLAVVVEDRQELVIGIIDYIRQYTWDKHLETSVKASGILGGSRNTTPTVISPKEYKKRFRKAISCYFVVVPESEAPPLLSVQSRPSLSLSEESWL